jgi:hypothetical protein
MPNDDYESVAKPHGTIIVTDVDGKSYQADTLRCVHCQKVWVVKKGSGIRRGFCTNCMGPTCGSDACCRCVPFEKKIELYEQGKIDRLT